MAFRGPRAARAIAACALLSALPGGARGAGVDPAAPCPATGDTVMVITRKRELWLCHDGAPRGRFSVALGRGGIDKHLAGDARTPLGTYVLGLPRPSEQFKTFIPIGYPTAQQAAEGYTGTAVGIHGPPRGQYASARWTAAFDWTMGCIATADDDDLQAIAEFVRERQPPVVIW
jgi:murein L,D-transpeptidase YafK